MRSFPPEHFAGARVTVMGLGHFGGQIAAVRFLIAQGADVTVTDIAPEKNLSESLKQIADLPVTLHLGGHIESDFSDTDLVVVSPAVPKGSRYLKLALEATVPVSCEMNLFLTRCRAKIIGITGTVGKSTTVTMLSSILDRARRTDLKRLGYRKVWTGGNIGKSLLTDVAKIKHNDLVILELSSFQLDDLCGIEFSPHIAVVINLFPNHLDRHVSFQEYLRAKANITCYQSVGDVLVVNGGDPACAILEEIAPGDLDIWRFGPEDAQSPGKEFQVTLTGGPGSWEVRCNLPDHQDRLLRGEDLCVPGRHNMENAAAASAAALTLGISPESIAQGLRAFKGLPDRLELVADRDHVRWYNDSKSTTPQSGIVAVRAFPPKTTITIAGGYDKELELSDFAQALAECSTLTICLGQTGAVLANLVRTFAGDAIQVDSLEQAVAEAAQRGQAGHCVLLSPGCASWDMFENYQARGEAFRRLVQEATCPVAAR